MNIELFLFVCFAFSAIALIICLKTRDRLPYFRSLIILFFLGPSQRFWHGKEEAAYLPHRRLREGLREDVSSPSSPALAQRRETLRLQLDVLREEVHQERRAAKTQEDTHR